LRTASFWWVGGCGSAVCDCGGVGLCFGWLPWDLVVWVWVCRRGYGGFGWLPWDLVAWIWVGRRGCGFAGVGMVGLGGCHGIRWHGFVWAGVGVGLPAWVVVGLGGCHEWVLGFGLGEPIGVLRRGVREGVAVLRLERRK
jgi:hypothetical protein